MMVGISLANHRTVRLPVRDLSVELKGLGGDDGRAQRLRRVLDGRAVQSCQCLGNILEQDHRPIKRSVSAMLRFRSFAGAATKFMGIEFAHRIRKHRFSIGYRHRRRYGSPAGACRTIFV
jgi:hypothetical protein